MNTATSTNWQAVIWLVMSAITSMDTGLERSVLLSVGMIVMAVIAWRTTGSGLSPKESQEILDTAEDIQSVLKRGRE